ncbi:MULTISPECIES: PH domain-containing protein [Rhodomicrobium]|uniref:PH domain-containing protein n=1 Tax=Rhodomicrobium TaxID=1068 RepID=UPI000B4B6F6C|nr:MULTISPECIES: PH domain-containing protein [Rhodomicrobium]
MSYIEDSLGANETVHYVAHFHWVHYALAYGALIVSVLLGMLSYNAEYPIVVLGPPLVGLVIYLAIMIPIWATEIGVTNQRLIYKTGIIKRSTAELQLRAIEQVNLAQDIGGRIFGYGKLDIHGTGNEEIFLPAIGNPLELRKALQEAIGEIQHATEPVSAGASPQRA